MRITFDSIADAAYVYVVERDARKVADTYPFDPAGVAAGIILDFDASRRLVGIELLNARQTLPHNLVDEIKHLTAASLGAVSLDKHLDTTFTREYDDPNSEVALIRFAKSSDGLAYACIGSGIADRIVVYFDRSLRLCSLAVLDATRRLPNAVLADADWARRLRQ